MRLGFRNLQELNQIRCEKYFHPCEDWNELEWAAAVAGEAGELCNLIKKCRRGDFTIDEKREEIGEEIADVIIYCDLLMTKLELDTGATVAAKFDKVSARVGFKAPGLDDRLDVMRRHEEEAKAHG